MLANTRKKSTSTRTSQKKNTAKKSSSTRGTKRTSSKKSTPKSTPRKAMDPVLKKDIIFYVSLLIFVFIALCLLGIIKEPIGTFVKTFITGIFGIEIYVIPFLLIIYWFINLKTGFQLSLPKKIGFILTSVFFGAILTLCSPEMDSIIESDSIWKDLYTSQYNRGGILLGILAFLLSKMLGKIGALILSILVIILSIFLFSGKSLLELITSLANREYDEDEDEEYDEEDDGQLKVKRKKSFSKTLDPDSEDEKKEKIVKKHSLFDIDVDKENFDRENADNNQNIISNQQADSDVVSNEELSLDEEDDIVDIKVLLEKRKEEKLERKREEEARKNEALDRKDDDRIVNSSRNNVNKSMPVAPIISKDDVHQINLIDSAEQTFVDTDLSVVTKEPKNSDIKEIYYDGFNDNKKTFVDEEIIKADSEEIPLETEPQYRSDSKANTVLQSQTNSEHNLIKPDDGIKDHVPQINDTPMAIPESVVKGISINPLEDVYNNHPDLDKMPTPVTERSHVKEAVIEKKPVKAQKRNINYKKPDINLLKLNRNAKGGDTDKSLQETALKLQETLKTFGVPVTVTDISQGPSVTRYELSLGEGIKVSKIVSLTDDIKLNLAAQDIRIEAPIPGKAAVGIELPNKTVSDVLIRDLLSTGEFNNAESRLTFAVGKDISGKTIVADIAKMPHMLIAGSTGSGKSVCINTLIMSILYKSHPDDVKLIMIDPKVVELSVYNGIPHLLLPVVTDPKKASATLAWAVAEMTERYNAFAKYGVRDLKGYNEKAVQYSKAGMEDAPEKKPQIIVIVDELADLMMVASKEVEESICRLAQLARAAGIHLIIATQRPSVDVITGLIKANMPSRVAFRVSSGVDSRTILDMTGAERLLGKGDMLFFPQGYTKPLRVQGAFVSDEEVSNVVEFLKKNCDPQEIDNDLESKISSMAKGGSPASGIDASADEMFDEYFREACKYVLEKGQASAGMLQRTYRIGFNRAARMIDKMESTGIISGENGTKPRTVLVTLAELEQILENLGI